MSDRTLHIMDTQFFNLISWNDKTKKIINYKEKSKTWFKKLDIFQLEHWIIPVNYRNHWFLIFVTYPNKIIDWGTYGCTHFQIKIYCSLAEKQFTAVEKIAKVIKNEWKKRKGQSLEADFKWEAGNKLELSSFPITWMEAPI